nr:desulfoviridin-type dissimilatory sulfite reductase beta subunit [Desulfovibrio vulgaris, (Hildenborough), Peptide Partial, 15 aa] [Nitratidesulfovibrio vulgaris]
AFISSGYNPEKPMAN